MPDTIRSKADILGLIDTTGSGGTSGQDVRDLLVSVMFPQLWSCGRLTLTSGVPVTSSDVTGAGTVYFSPFKGNVLGLHDGTSWVPRTFAETSLSLASGHATATNYDVFGYDNSGTLAIESLAWTNATTRATALVLQDGVYCKTGALTRRYLGSFRTTSSTTTEDSGGGTTTQVGGKRFLFNANNRVARPIALVDKTDFWAYTTQTVRQANGASGNKVEFLRGLDEDAISIALWAVTESKVTTTTGAVGIGLDSTTAFTGRSSEIYNANASTLIGPTTARYDGYPGVGYHYAAWLEVGFSGTGANFYGDDGGVYSSSGLTGTVLA